MSYVQDVMHEKFELIEVLGKYCLFTNLRVAHKDLPAGLYRYDLREGETEFFGSIEPFVLINHMGAILTKEPFEFEKEYEGDPYIVLDAETQPNFLDEMMTINEYMETTPEMIRCRDCAYLVEDDEGRWVCDDWGKDIHDVPDEDCAAEQGHFWSSEGDEEDC